MLVMNGNLDILGHERNRWGALNYGVRVRCAPCRSNLDREYHTVHSAR